MNIDRLFSVFKTAGRGLAIQRENIAIASENIANANTTRTDQGGPYRLKVRVFSASSGSSAPFNDVLSGQAMKLNTTNDKQFSVPDVLIKNGENAGSGDMAPNSKIVSENKFRYEYDPDNPDADENGMVKYPDINMVKEMTNIVSANRMYEANLSVIQAEKQIIKQSMNI
ncbi:MAG TPA: flagellar basal body rod protein FlgC [Balneolales bacterium]|nr:flagellar basal body rod protein FlgC [Balneolales bacterium]